MIYCVLSSLSSAGNLVLQNTDCSCLTTTPRLDCDIKYLESLSSENQTKFISFYLRLNEYMKTSLKDTLKCVRL